MSFAQRLEVYHKAGYPFIYITTAEEARVGKDILAMVENSRKGTKGESRVEINLYEWDFQSGLRKRDFKENQIVAIPDTTSPKEVLEYIQKQKEQCCLFVLKDFHLHINNGETSAKLIRMLKNASKVLKSRQNMVIFVSPVFKLPPELEKEIQFVSYALPDTEALQDRLNYTLTSVNVDRPEKDKFRIPDDINLAAIEAARGMTFTEAENAFCKGAIEAHGFDRTFVNSVFTEKVEQVRKSGLLTYIKTDISFNEVGGHAGLKKWTALRGKAFSKKALDFGLPYPKGILLAGVQGCGKTLFAKAVANEFGFPLFAWDIGSCFGSKVGETEANFRRTMETIEAIGQCVVLIDEIEKAFNQSAVSGQGDSGTSSRSFASVMTWLSERNNPCFLIGTSNDFLTLPPAFIRKGRFDELFFIDLPKLKEREDIFRVLLKRYKRDAANYDIQGCAKLAEDFSGAEIEAVIVAALYQAFDEHREMTNKDLFDQLKHTKPQAKLRPQELAALRAYAADKLKIASDEGAVQDLIEIPGTRKVKV